MPLSDAQGGVRLEKIVFGVHICDLLFSMKYLSVKNKIQ